eukprot:GHVU01037727.1.p1 GENE.GHVU01037727.1~~GHVU01037727.1.p1  ORF type:complete len:443 (+),score=28.48 GHVU01037727.1:173-1501(+)
MRERASPFSIRYRGMRLTVAALLTVFHVPPIVGSKVGICPATGFSSSFLQSRYLEHPNVGMSTDLERHLDAVKDVLPEWEDVRFDQVKLKPLEGGYSFRVTITDPDIIPKYRYTSLKLRYKRRDPVRQLIASGERMETLLGDASMGPKVLFSSDSMRLLEWVSGTPLTVGLVRNKTSFVVSGALVVAALHNRSQEKIFRLQTGRVHESNAFTLLNDYRGIAIKRIRKVLIRTDKDGKVFYDPTEIQWLADLPYLMEGFRIAGVLPNDLFPRGSTPSIARRTVVSHNFLDEGSMIQQDTPFPRLTKFDRSSRNFAGVDCAMIMLLASHGKPSSELISHELRQMFASVYLSEMLDKPVLPEDDTVIQPFVDDLLRFMLLQMLTDAMRLICDLTDPRERSIMGEESFRDYLGAVRVLLSEIVSYRQNLQTFFAEPSTPSAAMIRG